MARTKIIFFIGSLILVTVSSCTTKTTVTSRNTILPNETATAIPNPTYTTEQVTNTKASPSATISQVQLISTQGWQRIVAKTISIETPSEFSAFVGDNDQVNLRHSQNPESIAIIGLAREGDTNHGARISYTGASRREWFIKEYYDPKDGPLPPYVFTEKLYGSINGLEVRLNGALNKVLVAYKTRLYSFESDSQYEKTMNTIISTLKFL
jgi:hypothetical protein